MKLRDRSWVRAVRGVPWERAMRAKLARIGISLLLAASAPAFAQQEAAPVPAAPQTAPQPDPERPEYRARALPKDSFNPSEQVQEDQPVPFPEDV